jgi:hypothetical protein
MLHAMMTTDSRAAGVWGGGVGACVRARMYVCEFVTGVCGRVYEYVCVCVCALGV